MFPRLPARATFVADTNFVSGTQKMFLILFGNILCPQQMLSSLRSPRNIMGNNVSATMCPRLPRPFKALVNEDTLLPTMFLELRKLGNICCGHKMFLNKIRNTFCVPDTKFVSVTNVAGADNGETFVSATIMCPQQLICLRLPGP